MFLSCHGTIEFAEMNNLQYGDIVKKVASKKGTTEQAIKYLKEKKINFINTKSNLKC